MRANIARIEKRISASKKDRNSGSSEPGRHPDARGSSDPHGSANQRPMLPIADTGSGAESPQPADQSTVEYDTPGHGRNDDTAEYLTHGITSQH